MKNKYTILIFAVMLFASCGPTISGKDEQSFKTSKEKMEEKLDKDEKEKLEKALRIVVVKAMKEKWNKPDEAKYKDKSFNTISMDMIDGKTFSGIITFAEDFLKEDRDKSIADATKEIDSLTKEKAKMTEQNKTLDNFKLTKISISQDDYFDEMTPFLDLTFVNKTGVEVFGQMIQIDIFSKKTGEKIASQQQGTIDEIIPNAKDGDGIKPNETYSVSQPLLSEARQHYKSWKTIKYPATNFDQFDLIIKAYPVVIITKKEKLVRAVNLESMDKKIKFLQDEIKKLKETKGTLDELELTK